MKGKIGIVVMVISIVLLGGIYGAFLMTPPTPALPKDDMQAFQYKETSGSSLPASYVVEYVNPEAFVAVVTIRTFAMTDNAYSRVMDKAQPIVEEFAAEKFNQDLEVTKVAERRIDMNGHNAVQKEYEVRWQELANVGPVLDHFQELSDVHARMVLTAWFCHEDFKTICVAYIYLPLLQEPTEALVSSIQDVNTEGPSIVPFVGILILVDLIIVAMVYKKYMPKEDTHTYEHPPHEEEPQTVEVVVVPLDQERP